MPNGATAPESQVGLSGICSLHTSKYKTSSAHSNLMLTSWEPPGTPSLISLMTKRIENGEMAHPY